MLSYSEEAKKKKWSKDVKPKWHPPEGLFNESPAKIAAELKKHSENRQQAMGRLTFYMNRAGKNLSKEDVKRLEDAKVLLAAMYDREEEEQAKKAGKKKVSKENYQHRMTKPEFIRVYKDFLRKTQLQPQNAIVGAGGTCLLLGLRRDTADMDMAVSQEHFDQFLKSGKFHTHTFDGGERGEVLVIEWSDVIDVHAGGMDVPTMMIDGVCSWTPEYTLEFKKALNRPKDQEDIKALEKYIKRNRPSMESHPSLNW